MIIQIFKSYLTILLSVGLGSLLLLMLGTYAIFKSINSPKRKTPSKQTNHASDIDFTTISGDDIIATQLDLARAYIETGKHQLAQKILEYVAKNGTVLQQQEARILLGSS